MITEEERKKLIKMLIKEREKELERRRTIIRFKGIAFATIGTLIFLKILEACGRC